MGVNHGRRAYRDCVAVQGGAVYNAAFPWSGERGCHLSGENPEPVQDAEVRPDDLRGIREALGKTQEEMARLLSISTRAVQSYEQGWRPVPSHVRKMAIFLLCVSRRRKGRVAPCWRIRRCPRRMRATCAAYQLGEGELCWLVTGDACPLAGPGSADEKAERCARCPVLAERLRAGPAAH
jgi:putative transcriptional regulator